MPRPRRPLRRALFLTLALLLVLCGIELLAVGAWWIATGAPFTWTRAMALRAAATTTGPAPHDQPTRVRNERANARTVVHPYLGYVADASLPEQSAFVSRYGFHDDAPPLFTRGPDRFVVGITGGSVAMLLCDGAEATLVAALQRSPLLQGRRIEVVQLALGGYKQPQQLLAMQMVMLLGGQFDCVVNLDGFNDVSLLNEDLELGVPAWFPRSWAALMDRVPTPEQQLRLGHLVFLRRERQAMADAAGALWWSPTAQLVWLLRDRQLARRLVTERATAERAAVTPSFAVTGPGRAGQSLDDARAEMAQVWGRCSLQMHSLCASQGARYFHFLQPNQYVPGAKPIGPSEAKVAIVPDSPWDRAAQRGYPLLQQEGRLLQQAGVAFEDLTGIFRDHPEPLYNDMCCHLNHDGNALLAEHIAGVIRRRLELQGVVFDRLRVTPATVRLSSPLQAERLVVHGIDSHGGAHEITGTGFGTRVSSPQPERWALGSDDSVRALQRGAGELMVEHGALRATVPIVADWPDLLDDARDQPAPDGSRPRIELLSATSDSFSTVCRTAPRDLAGLAAAPGSLALHDRLGG
ncbi:MAG: hypothetical protein WAT39_03600 [Planctomycetota bacterium]